MGGKARAVSANPDGLTPLLGTLRQLIADSRQQVLRAVDVVQVQTCSDLLARRPAHRGV